MVMDAGKGQAFKQEIERCHRYYGSFQQAGDLLLEFYSCMDSFRRQKTLLEENLLLEDVDGEEAKRCLQKGESLKLNLVMGRDVVLELLQDFLSVLRSHNPELKSSMAAAHAALEEYRDKGPRLIHKEDVEILQQTMVDSGLLAQDLATLLFSLALSFFYGEAFSSLKEELPTELWEGGACPLCGENPHYGYLRSEDGAKVLQCWLCATSWVYTRIQCPFCSHTQQEDLGFFTAEAKEVCRMYVCTHCQQYHKIFDARALAGDTIIPFIHHLASLSHDYVAREEGFTPGSKLQWGETNQTGNSND